jgi:broad specificity phosphatase PhoE
VGRSPEHLTREFPNLKFDHLSDPWWWCPSGNPEHVQQEPESVVMTRVHGFLDMLKARPERSVAVVGHCTFFWLFSGVMMENCQVLTIEPHNHRIPKPSPAPGA